MNSRPHCAINLWLSKTHKIVLPQTYKHQQALNWENKCIMMVSGKSMQVKLDNYFYRQDQIYSELVTVSSFRDGGLEWLKYGS